MNVRELVQKLIKPFSKYLYLNKTIYTSDQEYIDKLLKQNGFIFDYMTEKWVYFKR